MSQPSPDGLEVSKAEYDRVAQHARETIRNVLQALKEADDDRDMLRAVVAQLHGDIDLLRAKLTAHHAIHNLPDDLVRDWAISYDHICPVCKEVESARTARE